MGEVVLVYIVPSAIPQKDPGQVQEPAVGPTKVDTSLLSLRRTLHPRYKGNEALRPLSSLGNGTIAGDRCISDLSFEAGDRPPLLRSDSLKTNRQPDPPASRDYHAANASELRVLPPDHQDTTLDRIDRVRVLRSLLAFQSILIVWRRIAPS